MDKYYFCIDVGGTTIKGGIVDKNNNIICKSRVQTEPKENQNYLTDSIMELINKLEDMSGLLVKDSCGVAAGVPGLVNAQTGVIRFSGNLKVREFPLKAELESRLTVPVKIANDADVATLAELKLGAGRKYKNFIMLTLGTGIGCGVVVDGKILGISVPYSTEVGHMKVTDTGVACSCGDKNCFEAVASTRALSVQTRLAMKQHPESKMWQKYKPSTVNGKTVFDFLNEDAVAKEVFKNYIQNLGNGIVSLYNIFMPEAVVLGGSISNEKERLTTPLMKYTNNHVYVKQIGVKTNIVIAEYTGDAGIVGGKFLFE